MATVGLTYWAIRNKMLPEGARKRLHAILLAATRVSQFTYDELESLRFAVLAGIRGSGGGAPSVLDLPCISAPVEDVKACLSPGWIAIRCYHGNVTWRVVRCRWCEGCRHVWRAKVRAIILAGCAGARVWMWTLTLPEYPGDMEEGRFDVAQDRWHALLRLAAKRGVRFEYLRVVELQKRGTPHFHLAIKGVEVGGEAVSATSVVRTVLVGLARASGFGYRPGKTFDLQAARLGGVGVASYMSKYLSKSAGFNELRRDDGRAIRRYCRSRGWSPVRALPVWRYARVVTGISRVAQSTEDVRCACGEALLLRRDVQAKRWVAANRLAKRWIAPLGVADYILAEEEQKELIMP